MATQHPVDELAAFALDALTEDERRATSAHLMHCAVCRATTSRYRNVAAVLALAAPQPPSVAPWLKRDIIQAAAAAPPPRRGSGAGARRRWSFPTHGFPTRWAAVLVVLALGLGILGGWALGDYPPGPGRASTAPTVLLASTSDAPGARGSLYSGRNATTLAVTGLPALPTDRIYEVWVASGEDSRPAGTFTTTADGRGAVVIDRPTTPGQRVAVTVEPAPGSLTPTGPILLEGIVGTGGS